MEKYITDMLYTLETTDDILICDRRSNDVTINLKKRTDYPVDQIYTIVKTSQTNNSVAIYPYGSDKFNECADSVLYISDASEVKLWNNGTCWQYDQETGYELAQKNSREKLLNPYSKLNFKKNVISLFGDGNGFVLTTGAGSSIVLDDTVFRTGEKSLKLIANAVSCQADKTITLNLEGKLLQVDVYISDITKVNSIDILLDPTGNWTSYFATSIPSGRLKTGWNTITLNTLDLNKLGSPQPVTSDLASVKKVRVKVVPVAGQLATANFDRFLYYDNGLTKGAVMFTFDDGHETVYTQAKPMMDEHGLSGTAFVITDTIGNAGKMTLDNLKTLQALGWDISSHTVNHLYFNETPMDEIDYQLSQSKRWLIDNGFGSSAGHLATPGGQFDNEILELIKKYYKTHRTVMEKHEVYPTDDTYTLKIRNIVNTTTLATVQGWVDSAVANNSLLILCLHYIMDPADTSTKILPSTFQSIVDYVASSNINVVTMSEMFG